jgi:hypothetical protein
LHRIFDETKYLSYNLINSFSFVISVVLDVT